MSVLRIVLPDQLDRTHIQTASDSRDHLLLAETGYLFRESTHRLKLALLASVGRHFAADARQAGVPIDHRTIGDGSHERSLSSHILGAAKEIEVDAIVATRPGSWCQLAELETAAKELGVELKIEEDSSFFSTTEEFSKHASGRKRLVMEYFYRELRRRHGILMDDEEPAGGEWNYDEENREAFGESGPGEIPEPLRFEPDEMTRGVVEDVSTIFPDAPGRDTEFTLPVTPDDARHALDDFIDHRLKLFGTYQDAMWSGERLLYHSSLSPLLNLRLLSPREAVARAEEAYRSGEVPIAGAEGFIRQILGWREFIRGLFYHAGRDYRAENRFEATRELPSFYWTGETRMRCVSDVMSGVLEHAYAHHIERLMVMGLFSLLAGLDPAELNDWHLSLYVDAYEWVSTPNVIGMSQYADGGLVATKPYAASGKYINRMSNYCPECSFNPDRSHGEEACPFTTLYWDFLDRHSERLKENRRMRLQLSNLERKSDEDRRAIRSRARELEKEILS